MTRTRSATPCSTHPQGRPSRCALSTREQWAVVEVIDQGQGRNADVSARLFERFYRADSSRTRTRGGSGLGLAIVAALVEAHGGRLELDTAPGRGATFRVLLPLAGPRA